jgi:antitoxin (DNA-binding transcriptional repressor) of toxin-antitoxin stability system
VIIAKNNEPVVRLIPVNPRQPRKQCGAIKGLVKLGPEFFEPLPAQEVEQWER